MADEAPTTDQGGSTTDHAPGSQATAGNGGTEPTYTQAQVTALVEDRLKRDREARERQAAKANEAAEADRLKQQQQFEQLADQRQARIAELEPQAQQAERYEAALRKHLDAQRKDLPAHITELLDQLDVAAQLEWISAHHAELNQANGTSGVPATPRANGSLTQAQVVEQTKAELRQSGRYAL